MSIRPTIITSLDSSLSYEVHGPPIGRGHWGTVYKASTPRGSTFAVKLNNVQAGSKANEKALEEARILEKIGNDVPNMLRYKTSFRTSEGGVAIVTNLLPCEDTFEVFLNPKKNRPPLTSKQITGIAIQCLESFVCLHMQGYAHRDIKPENIVFYEKTDQTYLIDFATAIAIDKIVQEPVGTYSYLSPEQVLSASYEGRLDESMDLWALGASLFTLYTKQAFISIPDEKEHWVNDYLHQMVLYFGMPSPAFVESLSPSEKKFFNTLGGGCSMPMDASPWLLTQITYLRQKKSWAPRGVPLWKFLIREVATLRQEGDDPEKIIKLLEPMFNYERRLEALTVRNYADRQKITARECLEVARSLECAAPNAAAQANVAEGKKD